MKASFARLVLGGLAAVALITTQAAPAGATVNVGVGVVQGSGNISPGLSQNPAVQTFNFTSADITGGGIRNKGVVTGTSSCRADGGSTVRNPLTNAVITDVPETSAGGTGSGTWSCSSGPLAGKGGKLYYVRVGAAVVVILTDGNKPPTGVGALVCVFVPRTTNPTTQYDLTCVGAVADVK